MFGLLTTADWFDWVCRHWAGLSGQGGKCMAVGLGTQAVHLAGMRVEENQAGVPVIRISVHRVKQDYCYSRLAEELTAGEGLAGRQEV